MVHRRVIGPLQSIKHRGLAYHYHCIYLYRRVIGSPQSIKLRGLAHCYTSSIYIEG